MLELLIQDIRRIIEFHQIIFNVISTADNRYKMENFSMIK